MAAASMREYRKAYAEDLFPPVDMEQFDPKVRTVVAGRMGRFVLDNCTRDMLSLGEEEWDMVSDTQERDKP